MANHSKHVNQKHVVVLSGAGMSEESGLKTFRDSGGLWEGRKVEGVATPEAWDADPTGVLDFYNQLRRQLYQVESNPGHLAIAQLEARYRVSVLTQNVDNLHERAGSSQVIHLHGELDFARSTKDESLLYPLLGKDIHLGDTCELGSQLRPHIVWFGENVPEMERAIALTETADIVIVVGTSCFVHPAARLVTYAPSKAKRYLINPEIPAHFAPEGFTCIQEKSGVALPKLIEQL